MSCRSCARWIPLAKCPTCLGCGSHGVAPLRSPCRQCGGRGLLPSPESRSVAVLGDCDRDGIARECDSSCLEHQQLMPEGT
jgi:DnaJ-class molecular chaperone